MQLFSPNEPLNFAAINILGLSTKTTQGNRFVVAMKDRYSKLIRAIPTPKVAAALVATIVFENWINSYGIPSTVLADNGLGFESWFFAALCALLRTRLVTTTENYRKIDGQGKRYNKTLSARLRHFIDERQTN